MSLEKNKEFIENNYNVIEYNNGHCKNLGKDANIIKNPIWKIYKDNKEILLMYCEKDTICKLCESSYQKILDIVSVTNNLLKLEIQLVEHYKRIQIDDILTQID